jgi:hypothetical protein
VSVELVNELEVEPPPELVSLELVNALEVEPPPVLSPGLVLDPPPVLPSVVGLVLADVLAFEENDDAAELVVETEDASEELLAPPPVFSAFNELLEDVELTEDDVDDEVDLVQKSIVLGIME